MKIVTAQQMRELDSCAINEIGIPGVALMENAGRAVVSVMQKVFGDLRGKQIAVLCGTGNNGGDGYVIARLLKTLGAEPFILQTGTPKPDTDAEAHYRPLHPLAISRHQLPLSGLNSFLQNCDLIVDALLGTGITDAPRGATTDAILAINAAKRPVIAVDIPSGVHADTGATPGIAVRADHTVTFAYPKRGHYLFPGAAHTGQLHIANIGFPWDALEAPCECRLITPQRFAPYYPLLTNRYPDAHKGTCGHVGIVAGSRGMTGAPALTARAAQRIGAGLVTLLAPACAQPMLSAKLDEQMTLPLPEVDGVLAEAAFDEILRFAERATVFCIGPGLTTAPQTVALVQRIVREIPRPLVLDADGLNALAQNPQIAAQRPQNPATPLILTPHPGEACRLLGTNAPLDPSKRIESVQLLAERFQAVVVLKGRYTLIGTPDGEVLLNTTGNPGMATGGSGDTLAGIIAGLLAQGFGQHALEPDEVRDLVALGVALHGLAGDIASETLTQAGLLASDITAHLPKAILQLEAST